MLDYSLYIRNMWGEPSDRLVSASLTIVRVIQEVLAEATKPVGPSNPSGPESLRAMLHSLPVSNNRDVIVKLKQKMDAAFEEFFVSGSQMASEP
jgi:hypothetical protein